MKTIIYLVALVLAFSSCDDEKEISVSSLPDVSREFITTHFKGVGFSLLEEDKDNGSTTYDVTLNNGVTLEFEKSGDWSSIECEFTIMPKSIIDLIPEGISTYLSEKHIDSKIIQIEKERNIFEIEINNHANDLIFTTDGTFVRYDY